MLIGTAAVCLENLTVYLALLLAVAMGMENA